MFFTQVKYVIITNYFYILYFNYVKQNIRYIDTSKNDN